MSRIPPIDSEDLSDSSRALVEQVQSKWGWVPNLIQTLAHSPAALDAYLSLSGALARGGLSSELREQIALAVAEANQCDYCLAAHQAIGKSVGLSDEEIVDGRRGESPDRRTDAALRFARLVVQKRGWIDDEDIRRLRDAGFGNAQIVEIVAHVGLNLFTNYFNHVAGTEVDFPVASALSAT